MIGLVDKDGTGSISYDEFIAVVEARPIKSRMYVTAPYRIEKLAMKFKFKNFKYCIAQYC